MKLSEALKIINKPTPTDAKPMEIFLVCGFEPLHLKTFLQAYLINFFPERRITIQSGIYGDIFGNLERSEKNKFESIIVELEWQDFDSRMGFRALGGWKTNALSNIIKTAQLNANRILEGIKAASQNSPAIIILPTLPLPPLSHYSGIQTSSFEISVQELLAVFSSRLCQIPNAKIVNNSRIEILSPKQDRYDIKSDVISGFPYQIHHASVIANLAAELVYSKPPKKGLITDLDETLWRGILGEDGVMGISWNLDNKSHLHALYQGILLSLAESGILIGVASKNNPELVDEAFKRKDIILPAEKIFPVEANWGAKPKSIEKILKIWNINADSVVFIDDSPIEIAQVKAAYPQIECLLFPTYDEKGILELIYHLRDIFGKDTIQKEDIIRIESIKKGALGDATKTADGESSEKILSEADAELEISFAKDINDSRAFELVNKTNQFNLNGKRYTAGEWQDILKSENTFLFTISYHDKYGPLGKIAVILGRKNAEKIEIDTWVMSCRAFGRRIEYKCLDILFEKMNVQRLEFNFAATDRNQPLQEFFEVFLGKKPSDRFVITKEIFQKNCPVLYHKIKENINE